MYVTFNTEPLLALQTQLYLNKILRLGNLNLQTNSQIYQNLFLYVVQFLLH